MSQKEHKQVTQCLRRRLAWCNATGRSYNPALEQYSVYPRALSDCDGNPHEGVKSTWTEKLRGCYKHTNTFFESLPSGWSPSVVVLDGMFLLNTNPLRQTNNVTSYANLLFNQFIKPHYLKGASTVHLILITPADSDLIPKNLNKKREMTERENKAVLSLNHMNMLLSLPLHHLKTHGGNT